MWYAIYLEHTDFIYTYWIVNAVKLSLKDKFKQSVEQIENQQHSYRDITIYTNVYMIYVCIIIQLLICFCVTDMVY
jgi:hypothetical protein